MAKFRKNDLKLIVKELVRESLLEILAEEFIEEATFRAVESASSQIVGTVTGQINKQLKPIMERIQHSAGAAPQAVSSHPVQEDEYIDNLEEDYGSISVAESLGLSDLGDVDSMDSVIANVRSQMQKEREAADASREDVSVSAQLGFGDELPGPKPTKKLESAGPFDHLIQSSASTLREQAAASRTSVGPDMFNISNTGGSVAQVDKKSDPLFFKKIVDKVNQRSSSSPILGAQAAAAQQAHQRAQMSRVADSDLDRPAHEVLKQSR